MARFDDELIRRLKEETDIVALIERYGTKLRDRGKAGEMIGLCPIHDDKNPSLVVNRSKNVWNCLGACGCGGDVIQWIMHAEKASFRHAVELLNNGATGSSGGKRFTTERKLDCPLTTDADDQQALVSVVDYYHLRLAESPAAIEYLEHRGIADRKAIEQFRIGFVDRTLGLRLPAKQIKAGSELRDRLKGIGIVRDSGHEHFRGCVTFPLLGEDGTVKQLYGRRIDNGQRKQGKHFYLPRPHGGIFNIEAFRACDELILCESVIDALTFWVNGFRNVTCTYGTNGLTDEMLQAFKLHAIQRVLIAFDADEAGNNGADKLAEPLGHLGIERFRLKVTAAAKDINAYALTAGKGDGNVHNWLALLIRNAEWLGKGTEPQLTTQTPDFLKQARERIASDNAASESSVEAAKEKKLLADDDEKPSSLAAVDAGSAIAEPVVAEPVTAEATQPPKPSPKEQPIASPAPAPPTMVEAEVKENEIIIPIGNRIYRVRGLARNSSSVDTMKVNVLARRDDLERFHVDTFDLYAARARTVFIKEAAYELGFDGEVIKRDLGKVLLKLESLQDEQTQLLDAVKAAKFELNDTDKQAALDLLRQPNLIERILHDFDAVGVVGEETNKLVGYLAATSRKLDKPLAIVIQSSSAAGKSSLMDAVLRFIPDEEQVGYSAMTGQSLFYMGGMELSHKILAIAEEEGVAQASYALKLLQSEGQLTIASTGKDPGTGRMETQEYHVEGPVMIFLTTTAIDIDEELMNRCIVLSVDENREQTRAIHTQQRKNETLEGLLTGKRSSTVRKLHQDAQRLIRPLAVVNPFAAELRFCDDQARRRRDHMKYLAIIRSIALLHQYQRDIETIDVDGELVEYIEVTRADIALANRLADQVLGKSIDELPTQTRRLLLELHGWIIGECKRLKVEQREFQFTRRMVRESIGWNQTALKKHLDRLLEMEYVIPHRGEGRRVQYELLYDGRGREGQPTMCGLIDAAKLPGDAPKPIATTTASSPLEESSSPLDRQSSPSKHPKITPSSPQGERAEPSKNWAEMS